MSGVSDAFKHFSAQATVTLERLLAKERRTNFTPASVSLPRVAEEIFSCLEEFPNRPWHEDLQTGHPVPMSFDQVDNNVSETELPGPSCG